MKAVELFVGAGGMGLGGSAAGLEPLAVVDWDKWACETIRENAKAGVSPFNEWPVHECDVRRFDYSDFDQAVDIVTGGPPCQPFSLGGRHQAHLDQRDMFPQAVRAVRELRPRAFVFENVKGLTRDTFRNYFEYIRLQLKHPDIEIGAEEGWSEHLARLEDFETSNGHRGLNYQVITQVLNAADYGVPQRRERVFFVGFRSDLEVSWHFPEPTHSRERLIWDKWRSGFYWDRHRVAKRGREDGGSEAVRAERLREEPALRPWATVREALIDLPEPTLKGSSEHGILNHRLQPGARTYPGHTGSPLDAPAKTLKAGVHGVPGGENMLRRPDGSVRYFTVRESARLQTFPDNMVLHGSWTEAMRQLGNAVPVELARVVIGSVSERLRQIA